MRPPQKGTEGGVGLGVMVVAVIAFLVLISRCSSSTDTADTSAAKMMDANISAGVAAQGPPAVEPLNSASIARGVAHFNLAYRAEAFPGAMIYSQNCYDALTRKFSWAKLDVCGALDMLAARAIQDSDVTGLHGEAAYFESEMAAGRYLAAATGGGEEPAEADTRLSALQGKVARASLPVRTEKVAEPDNATEDSSNNASSPVVENAAEPAESADMEV